MNTGTFMKTTFLLGMGCQKGGTTWLHQYLNRHPNVNSGGLKEYHFFDQLYHPELFNFRCVAEELTKTLKMRRNNPAKAIRMAFYKSPKKYFKHFQRLAKPKHISVVSDITPSYSALSEQNLIEIKAKLELCGFHVKVLYFMRDPIERICSSTRMGRRRLKEKGETLTHSFQKSVAEAYDHEYTEIRTHYHKTLPAIENVFPPDDFFCDFYESFYSRRDIKPITDFLDIPYIPADFGAPISNRKKEDISDELKHLIFTHYRHTYDFIANRFGHDYIASIWPNFRILGAVYQDR